MLQFTAECFDHQTGGFFSALVLTRLSILEPSNTCLCYNRYTENGQRKITSNIATQPFQFLKYLEKDITCSSHVLN